MSAGVVVLVFAGSLLFAAVMFLIVQVTGKPHLYRGTGWDEWRAAARRPREQDQRELKQANVKGRATTPELAPLAAQRGRAVLVMLERYEAWGPGRWAYRVMIVCGLLIWVPAALQIARGRADALIWLQLLICTGAIPLYLLLPRQQRRQRERVRRSVERNEAVVASGPGRSEGGDTATSRAGSVSGAQLRGSRHLRDPSRPRKRSHLCRARRRQT